MAREKFTWHPKFESTSNMKPTVSKLSFGDGYEHRQAQGLNWRKREHTLSFQAEESVILDIDAFLWARGGVESFDWVSPDKKAQVVVCETWSIQRQEGAICTLNATFRQVYE
ncbi:phage tail protein [Klebsiella pneumoniae]|nr:phage tail protein [Klebsiella pneumoniae]